MMSKLGREIAGRAALLIVGLALLIGGWKCVSVARELQREWREQNPRPTYRTHARRSTSGAGLPYAIGFVLLGVGGVVSVASVLPLRRLERWLGPQTNNTLWENPSADEHPGPGTW